jgi:SNF2 family DNA or RNA helicase
VSIHVKVSAANRALVVPPVMGVEGLFGDAPTLPDGNKIIAHGMRETLLLRHLGFQVPNPIMYYDFPGGTPYAVQRKTAEMLVENPRAYVLNGMGTGKTKTALWAWDFLYTQGLAGKLLVVAPLSTLRFVWAAEIFRTLPKRRCQVLHGSRQVRLERLGMEADIYIINHDGLKTIESELRARSDITVLVIDELAVYRNTSTRTKRMWKFAEKFTTVWGLTGAPMPNEPTDVWAQCKIITPGTVPKFKNHARDMLMVNITNYIWKPKPDAVERAFSWMQPSLRYALDEVVELPPLISRTMDIPLSPQQDKVYTMVARAMQAEVANKTITAVNAGAAMNKLLQIAGGWVYTVKPEFVRVDPTPRIVAMAGVIQSAEHKVLVAIPYRHMIDGISKILNMKGVEVEHCVVHGDTPNRDNLFNIFQNTDKYKVMLVHPQCVAHGVTLTAADTILWYLPIPSLDIYDQFNARFRRIGQQHKQQLIHLQSTPVEKKLYRMLREHQKMQNEFLQLVQNATGEA